LWSVYCKPENPSIFAPCISHLAQKHCPGAIFL
jgi:hypothetical protein